MKRFRPLILLVLLLTVPFQAAVGASGMCATMSHHGQSASLEVQGHDGHDRNGTPLPDHHVAHAMTGDDHHAAMPSNDHHAAMAADDHLASTPAGAHDTPDTPVKCKVCNECCSAAAPVPAGAPSLFSPDAPVRVSALVATELVFRSGDGLFRPPRTTSV